MKTILLSNSTHYLGDLNKKIKDNEMKGYEVISTQFVSGIKNKYNSDPEILVTMQKTI